MKIVALDSSGLVASVAVMTEDTMIAEYTVNHKKTHSQTLLPMLDEIMRMTEQDIKDVDAIAVAAGPGSFTGLRIGSATAKGLGLALDKPIVEIPTVDALAFNFCLTGDAVICPIMDARREEVYTGIYEFVGMSRVLYDSETGEGFHVISEQKAVPLTELLGELESIGRKVIFIGDGIPVYRDIIDEKLSIEHCFAPQHMAGQRAGAVGALAFEYIKRGRTINADEHVPVYLRVSQAERELNAKG